MEGNNILNNPTLEMEPSVSNNILSKLDSSVNGPRLQSIFPLREYKAQKNFTGMLVQM